MKIQLTGLSFLLGSLAIHGVLVGVLSTLRSSEPPRRLPAIELIDRELVRDEPPPLPPLPPDTPAEKPPPEPLYRPKVSKKPPRKQPVRTRKRVTVDTPPPAGKPTSETPAAPDTDVKAFSIDIPEGQTSGPGISVPTTKDGSDRVSPSARRVGKGKKDGKRLFKKSYKEGDYAPRAVVTQMPKPLTKVQPVYPEAIRELGIEGQVVLELTIGEKGRVKRVRVIRKLNGVLDKEAIKAARRMRFSPAKVGQVAVSVTIEYRFTFVLD